MFDQNASAHKQWEGKCARESCNNGSLNLHIFAFILQHVIEGLFAHLVKTSIRAKDNALQGPRLKMCFDLCTQSHFALDFEAKKGVSFRPFWRKKNRKGYILVSFLIIVSKLGTFFGSPKEDSDPTKTRTGHITPGCLTHMRKKHAKKGPTTAGKERKEIFCRQKEDEERDAIKIWALPQLHSYEMRNNLGAEVERRAKRPLFLPLVCRSVRGRFVIFTALLLIRKRPLLAAQNKRKFLKVTLILGGSFSKINGI